MLPGYDLKDLTEFILDERATLFHSYSGIATSSNFINCKIVSTPGVYGFRPTGMGYQKDSPYAEIFDYNIERMRASGVLDRIKSKYSSSPQVCPDLR